MVAFISRMPVGVPGAVTRAEQGMTIQPELIDSTTPPTAYGQFVKLVAGKVQPVASGDAATVIMGLAVRAYPVQSATNALGVAAPPASGIINVLRRGYMAVTLAQGTAAKGAPVYVRATADTGKAVGDIETAADSGKCVAVPGAFFEGAADANGITEISFNI